MTVYLAKGGLFVGGSGSGGGGTGPAGPPGPSGALPFVSTEAGDPLPLNAWTYRDGAADFPITSVFGTRFGIVTVGGIVLTLPDAVYITYNGAFYPTAPPPQTILIPAALYTEWQYTELIPGNGVWVQQATSGIAPAPGLKYLDTPSPAGVDPQIGYFVLSQATYIVDMPVAAQPNERIGIFVLASGVSPDGVLSLTPQPGQPVLWQDTFVDETSTVDIKGGNYVEFVTANVGGGSTLYWIPASNVSGTSSGSGWLTYSTANDPDIGEWVIMAVSPISLPTITDSGQHVAFYVRPGFGPALISNPDELRLRRSVYNGGSNIPIHDGGWYEFVSRDEGEGFSWYSIASGDTSNAPLESSENAGVRPDYPNMWSLGSRDTAHPLPYNPLDGDSYAIYADVDCSVFCFDPGANIEAPDLSGIFASPDGVNLTAGTYYEWIYTAGDNTWHPRQNMLMLPGGSSGGGSLPIIPGDVGTPTVNTWALFPGGTFTFPELVPSESQIGLFTLAATTLTAPSGRQFLYNGVLYEGPASVAIPAYVYCEWSYLQSTFGDTTMWVPRGASNESTGGGGLNADTLTFKKPVRVVATVSLTLSGLQTVDSVSLVAGDRILLTNQSATSANGIYTVASGAWSRATDADTSAKVTGNLVVVVSEGSVYQDSSWMLTTNDPIVLGTTGLTFVVAGKSTLNPIAIDATNAAFPGSANRWAPQDHVHAVTGPYKNTVRVVSTNNLGLTGLVTVDGIALTSLDRVLAIAQSTASANGIYIAQSGAWVRAGDADVSAKVPTGTLVPVSEGTTYADTVWMLSTNAPITLGTTSLAFVLLMRGSVAASIVQASQAAAIGASPKFATADHVHAMEAPYNGMSGFRLSNNAASPIPVSGSSSNVYIVPYDGYRISLYNGSIWVNVTLSSVLSQVVSGLAVGVPVDVFLAYTGLTGATIVQINWANATTRATTLSLLSGVYVNSSAPTQRYIGTFLPDGTASYSHLPTGSAICGIWNQNNRIKTSFQRLATFGSAVPGTPSIWAPPGGMAAPHIQLLNPQLDGDEYSASAVAAVTTTGTAEAGIGIGFDSTNSVQGIRGASSGSGSSTTQTLTARAATRPTAIGVRTVNMLLYVTGTGPDFIGNTDPVQAGIIAEHWH